MKQSMFVTILSLGLLLAACAPPSAEAPPEPPAPPPTEEPLQEPEAEPVAAAPETVTFRDDLDREVTLEVPAGKIVSLAPSVTETLFAIGAGEQVIGRTDYCDYPEEVSSLPSIGGFDAATISVESIVALEPDLVIGGSIYQAEVIQALEAAGIPAFVTEPSNLAEIMDAVTLLGQVTGQEAGAEQVYNDMQARIDAVEAAVSAVPVDQRPSVFYEVWHEPLMSANGNTVVGELIEIAGGENIFADLPDEYPTVSVEQIVVDDPLFIIGPSSHGDQMSAEVIGAREGWEDLTAVKENAIHIVDGNMVSRASPRVVLVLEEFARILHPDLFE